MTAAMPYEAPTTPVRAGRLAGLALKPMMVYAPEPMPAAPTPAMARPTMRATLVGATPQMREPTSKMKMATRKLIFRGKYLYALPPCLGLADVGKSGGSVGETYRLTGRQPHT